MTDTVDFNQFASQDPPVIIREASELGLRPGRFPRFLGLDTDTFVYVCTIATVPDREILEVRYQSPTTHRRLVVLND